MEQLKFVRIEKNKYQPNYCGDVAAYHIERIEKETFCKDQNPYKPSYEHGYGSIHDAIGKRICGTCRKHVEKRLEKTLEEYAREVS